jgi:hypothetical protein
VNQSAIFPQKPKQEYQQNDETHNEISAKTHNIDRNRGQPQLGLQDQSKNQESDWNRNEDHKQTNTEALKPNHGSALRLSKTFGSYCAGVHHSGLVSFVGSDIPIGRQ